MAFAIKSIWGGGSVRTIRKTLLFTVLACVLPAWIGMALLIQSLYAAQRDRVIQNTIQTARALGLAIDRDLTIAQASIEILASSPQLNGVDFTEFHKVASDLVQNKLPGDIIVLSDPTGQQLVNTLRPSGERLPIDLTPGIRTVFSTGRPAIDHLIIGAVSKKPLIPINVPVIRDGNIKYNLAITLTAKRFSDLLDRQNLPPEWVVSIFDASGIHVARTRNADKYVGKTGTPALMKILSQQTSGFIELSTLEGIPVYSAFSRSEASNWAVAIGMPAAEINRDLYLFLGLSSAGALVLLGFGLALARHQSKLITSAMKALVEPAAAFGRGEATSIPPLGILEIDEVGQALRNAFHVLQSRTEERDLAQSEKEVAQRIYRLKDEFIATVSHELRTPLTSIHASLGLLNSTPEPQRTGSTRRLIEIAFRNSQRLVLLVNDILDIEKLEAGKAVFDLRFIEIGALLDQAIEAIRPMAENSNIKIRRLDAPNCEVHADPNRLMQVFANLLSNAVKFSPNGSEVVVSTEAAGDSVRVLVRDHGTGIPEKFKERIFEKFAQADSSDARKQVGTGLGLSIVQSIVHRLGGRIGFEDASGGGTIFFVELAVSSIKERGLSVVQSPNLVYEDADITVTNIESHFVP